MCDVNVNLPNVSQHGNAGTGNDERNYKQELLSNEKYHNCPRACRSRYSSQWEQDVCAKKNANVF